MATTVYKPTMSTQRLKRQRDVLGKQINLLREKLKPIEQELERRKYRPKVGDHFRVNPKGKIWFCVSTENNNFWGRPVEEVTRYSEPFHQDIEFIPVKMVEAK
jgi:hypothetical protein